MSARAERGLLTINNIIEITDENPEIIFDEVQSIIDAQEYDIPDEAATSANVKLLQHLQAYYGNQYPYLIGLWGVLRHATDRSESKRVAMRDYLEKAASACKLKYEAASRMLTGYQVMNNDYGVRQ